MNSLEKVAGYFRILLTVAATAVVAAMAAQDAKAQCCHARGQTRPCELRTAVLYGSVSFTQVHQLPANSQYQYDESDEPFFKGPIWLTSESSWMIKIRWGRAPDIEDPTSVVDFERCFFMGVSCENPNIPPPAATAEGVYTCSDWSNQKDSGFLNNGRWPVKMYYKCEDRYPNDYTSSRTPDFLFFGGRYSLEQTGSKCEIYDGNTLIQTTNLDDSSGETQVSSVEKGGDFYTATYGSPLAKITHTRDTKTLDETYWVGVDSLRTRVTRVEYGTDGGKRFLTSLYCYDINGNLTMVVDPEGVKQYLINGHLSHGVIDSDPSAECALDDIHTVTDGALANYASEKYEYDEYTGKLVSVEGSSCCGGSGKGKYKIGYGSGSGTGVNEWATYRRIQYVQNLNSPVGGRAVEFLNEYGQVVYYVEQSSRTDVPTSSNTWITHYVYYDDEDRMGYLKEIRYPSACKGYTIGYEDVLSGMSFDPLRRMWVNSITPQDTQEGLVRMYGYADGDAHRWVKMRRGTATEDNDEYWVSETIFEVVSGGSSGDGGCIAFNVKEERVYPTLTTIQGDGVVTTEYEYTYDETDPFRIVQRKVIYPAVDTDHNGPGTSYPAEVIHHYAYDETNSLYWNDWTKHEDGTYSYTKLGTDAKNLGQVIKSIVDVDTSLESTGFPGGDDWPARTSKEHLVTEYDYYNDTYGGGTYATYGQLKEVTSPGGRRTVYATTQQYKTGTYDSQTTKTTTSLVSVSTPHMDDDDDYDYAPVNITVSDLRGRAVISASAIPSTSGTPSTAEDGDLLNEFGSWATADTDVDALLDNYNGTLCGLTFNVYDFTSKGGELGEVRQYHTIPSSTGGDDEGALGTNYYRTVYQYDGLGRQEYIVQVVSGTSTSDGVEQVSKTVYDSLGRYIETHVGVSPASGTGSDMGSSYTTYPTLVKVSESFYDEVDGSDDPQPGSGTSGVGDGLVTSVHKYHGTGTNDWTGTANYYNWRHQLRGVSPIYYDSGVAYDEGPYIVYDLDNLGRTTAVAQFSSSQNFTTTDDWDDVLDDDTYAQRSSGYDSNRRALTTTHYDERGQVYQTKVWSVDASNGSADAAIVTNNYYDQRGRLVATSRAKQGTMEYAYDDAGRQVEVRLITDMNSPAYYSGEFDYRTPEPGKAGGDDYVVEMTRLVHDDEGNVIEQHHYEANVCDAGMDLTNNDDYVRTSVYSWYDELGRLIQTANYGTSDTTWEYHAATARAEDPTTVTPSSTVLVTTYEYGDAGQMELVTDPLERATKYCYDDLGRRTYVVENCVDFAESTEAGTGGGTYSDDDRVTKYVYNGLSQVTELTAMDSNGDGSTTTGDDQTTKYWYLDGYNASLVTDVVYPDSDDDEATDTDHVKMTHNLDGSVATRTAQKPTGNATVITFDYDSLRRLEKQRVTQISSSEVDDHIEGIKYTYDGLGRIEKVTSCTDSSCTIVANEVQMAYNGLGQLEQQYQALGGCVSTTSPISPYVEYAYETTASAGVLTKSMRLKSIKYPNSRLIHYRYDANYSGYGEYIAYKLSRLAAIRDDSTSTPGTPGDFVDNYFYSGSGRLLREVFYNAPNIFKNIALEFTDHDATPYVGFDRFGRIVNQHWLMPFYPTDLDKFEYTYDANSNRTARDITLASGASGKDEKYTYDDLNRLIMAERGTLSSGSITSPQQTVEWDLDALGNWSDYKINNDPGSDSTYEDATDLEQTREHNAVNEIYDASDAIGERSSPNQQVQWLDPTYDAVGNMINGPVPGNETVRHHYRYDAWDRLVEVYDDDGGSPNDLIAQYRYDGLNRRIRKYVKEAEENEWTVIDYYHNANWQVVEQRKDTDVTRTGTPPAEPSVLAASDIYVQYIWSARYIDAPVVRDENKDADSDCVGGSDERLYYLADANMNVTALVDTGGDVVERYRYDPYGARTVFDGSWNVLSGSGYDNTIAFCGYRLDDETGLYHVRYRYLNPPLGRWTQRDPSGYDEDKETLIQNERDLPPIIMQNAGVFSDNSRSGTAGLSRTPHGHEGHNLYQYVRSMPSTLSDPSGLISEGACTCGPDITDNLRDMERRLKKEFGLMPWRKKRLQCQGIIHPHGWDILQLYYKTACTSVPGCGVGGSCNETVEVLGKCYPAGDVNYLLWGIMSKLCKIDSFESQKLAIAYKLGLNGIRSVVEWSANNWPEALSEANAANRWTVAGRRGIWSLNQPQRYAKSCKLCGHRSPMELTWNLRVMPSIWINEWVPFEWTLNIGKVMPVTSSLSILAEFGEE